MPKRSLSLFVRRIRDYEGDTPTDGELLSQFLSLRDETSIAVLVERHAPMVWGVCSRILRHPQDAEDAFQATFLVLIQKAETVQPREMLAHWLYGVAQKTALRLKASAAKRGWREGQRSQLPEAITAEAPHDDSLSLLDEEMGRLPTRFRNLIVLCDLEGRTRTEVARQLGCPEGTVASRLSRARDMLAKRLTRRGLVMTSATLSTVLSQAAMSASVPTSTLTSTINVATLLTAGNAAGLISGPVAMLTQGVLQTMMLKKILTTTFAVLALSAAVITGGSLALGQIGTKPKPESTTEPPSTLKPPRFVSDPTTPVPVPGPAASDLPPNDLERLQGQWVSRKITFDPPIQADVLVGDVYHELLFEEQTLTSVTLDSKTHKEESSWRGPFKLNQTATPKQLSFENTEKIEWSYHVQGDNLKIARFVGSGNGVKTPGHPKGFTAQENKLNPGGHLMVIEYTRGFAEGTDPREIFWKLYSLKDGEDVKYIPLTPAVRIIRQRYQASFKGGSQLKPGQILMCRFERNELVGVRVKGGAVDEKGNGGEWFSNILQAALREEDDIALEFAPDSVDPGLLSGDWVIRTEATSEARVKGLIKVLNEVCKVPVDMKLADLERDVMIASGEYKFSPRKWRKDGVWVCLLEEDDAKLVNRATSQLGGLDQFLRELGKFAHVKLVAGEVKFPPRSLRWYLVQPNRFRQAAVVHEDPLEVILNRVTEQTGLTFKPAKRKVPVLTVKTAPIQDDAKLLQGVWKSTKVTFDPPVPPPQGPPGVPGLQAITFVARHELTISADEVTWASFGTEPLTPGTPRARSMGSGPLKLNTKANPKQITVENNECIYELEGDKLKLAMYSANPGVGNTPGRPKGFTAKDSPPNKDCHVMVIEFTREKDDEPAWKKEIQKLYSLRDGEDVRFVPFTPEIKLARENYFRETFGHIKEAMRLGSRQVMTFEFGPAGVVCKSVRGRGGENTGVVMADILSDAFKSDDDLRIQLDPRLAKTDLPGDWIFRKDATIQRRMQGIEKALREQCKTPVDLTLANEERDVFVASGAYKLAPREWSKFAVHVYADEKDVDKKNGDPASGGTVSDLKYFLKSISGYTGVELVAGEILSPPKSLMWYYHERNSPRIEGQKEDHDAVAILKNVSEQTGLIFTPAKRKLPLLTVKPVTESNSAPSVSVTGRKGGKEVAYAGGQATVAQGLAIALFGSARLEFPATEERWKASLQRDHLLLRFEKPVTLAMMADGKKYEVDEILIRTNPNDIAPAARNPKADWGAGDTLMIRCGDKYYSFAKYEGVLMEPLLNWFGASPSRE
ncbi:MAG: sigma-70 family RNA polymerase sigma factor [Fimbriiglobus sp.]